jgi:hypothetical protein
MIGLRLLGLDRQGNPDGRGQECRRFNVKKTNIVACIPFGADLPYQAISASS